ALPAFYVGLSCASASLVKDELAQAGSLRCLRSLAAVESHRSCYASNHTEPPWPSSVALHGRSCTRMFGTSELLQATSGRCARPRDASVLAQASRRLDKRRQGRTFTRTVAWMNP